MLAFTLPALGVINPVGALAQGSIILYNHISGSVITHIYLPSPANPDLVQMGNGPTDYPPGTTDWTGWTPISGSGFTAQLFAAEGVDLPMESLAPAFPTTTFLTGIGAGILHNQIATMTNVSLNAPVATVQVRVWDNRGGTINDWGTATAEPFEVVGVSGTLNVLGDFWDILPHLVGLQSFNLSASPRMVVQAKFTNVAIRFPVLFTGMSTVPIVQSVWDFGDGTLATNQPSASHAWSAPGTYTVRLTGYTNGGPGSVSGSVQVAVTEGVYYVDAASSNPVVPYTSWQTAAQNLEDAAAPAVPGSLVWVTNGVYGTGSFDAFGASRVVLPYAVAVRSVNGPRATTILGDTNGVRCAWVSDGAVLDGFTLTNGMCPGGGGGVACASTGVVTNCIIVNGSAYMGGGANGGIVYNCSVINSTGTQGGGDWGSVLYNCILVGNSSAQYGGGADYASLYNCTLSSNSAVWYGGGADSGALYNCRLIANSAGQGGGAESCALSNCVLTANWTGSYGGGAQGCALTNCLLVGNSATNHGGGADYSTLVNCTASGNSAGVYGGGVAGSGLFDSIVYFNHAPQDPNASGGDVEFCCTTPLPPNGLGNTDADPRFMNATAGDFRLLADSPCIDAGTNLVDLPATDLQGLPRVMDGNGDGIAVVDMGAYEFNPYRFEPPLVFSTNGFQFTIRGEPEKMVRIEASADLLTWDFVAIVPIPPSGQALIDPAATSAPFRFYRAIALR